MTHLFTPAGDELAEKNEEEFFSVAVMRNGPRPLERRDSEGEEVKTVRELKLKSGGLKR